MNKLLRYLTRTGPACIPTIAAHFQIHRYQAVTQVEKAIKSGELVRIKEGGVCLYGIAPKQRKARAESVRKPIPPTTGVTSVFELGKQVAAALGKGAR